MNLRQYGSACAHCLQKGKASPHPPCHHCIPHLQPWHYVVMVKTIESCVNGMPCILLDSSCANRFLRKCHLPIRPQQPPSASCNRLLGNHGRDYFERTHNQGILTIQAKPHETLSPFYTYICAQGALLSIPPIRAGLAPPRPNEKSGAPESAPL